MRVLGTTVCQRRGSPFAEKTTEPAARRRNSQKYDETRTADPKRIHASPDHPGGWNETDTPSMARTLCNRTVRYVTTVRLWGPTQERDLVKGRTTTTYDVRRPWRFTARHLALGRLLRARRANPLLNVRCGCDANCRVPTEAALPPKPEPKSGSRRARRRSASNVAPSSGEG